MNAALDAPHSARGPANGWSSISAITSAKYLFCGMPAGDPDVVIPNLLAIVERIGRPESRAPGVVPLLGLLPDEIVDT
jgi:hypothetical protein